MLTPVILCGGSGTRLWPLSRKSYPKQFVPFAGADSLFQATAKRLSAPGYAPPLVVTGAEFRFIVAEQLLAAGVEPGTILIEPEPRNTGPAILAAAMQVAAADPGATMLVAPSDHIIGRPADFRLAVAAGIEAAEQGRIVTFGVVPDRPETGYGWIEAGTFDADGMAPLIRFVEKPDAGHAAEMLASGLYLWNMGVFLARAGTFVDAFRSHAPAMIAPVAESLAAASSDLGFLRLAREPWRKAPSTSFDYAVMEKADAVSVIRHVSGWSDLGDWEAVRREVAAPADRVTQIDCTDTLLRSEDPGTQIVGLGLTDIIAVAAPDAVLVAHRTRAQDVRLAVEKLRAKGAVQADRVPREYRPWGWYESLAMGDRFQVKRICVHPGGRLSLQSHVHRAEHWIVVSGTVRVTLGERTELLTENQSVYIPLGTVHRLENPGKVDATLIEVQTGAYLGEDDITRYADAYSREGGPPA